MLAGKGLSVRSGHFQSNDPGWQTCLQQTRYRIKQRRKRISRFLVVITRYGVKIMVQGKGHHTPCQTSELRPHLFRWTGREMFVFRQPLAWEFSAFSNQKRDTSATAKLASLSLLSRHIVISRLRRERSWRLSSTRRSRRTGLAPKDATGGIKDGSCRHAFCPSRISLATGHTFQESLLS
jgi:hypothetical protein